MHIQNTTFEAVKTAAADAMVKISDDWKFTNQKETNIRLRLMPLSDQYRRLGFNRNKNGNHRRINAVCFHGYLHFMRKLYQLSPDAIIRTAHAVYRSADELEANMHIAGSLNIGSHFEPLQLIDACVCSDVLSYVGDDEPVDIPVLGQA